MKKLRQSYGEKPEVYEAAFAACSPAQELMAKAAELLDAPRYKAFNPHNIDDVVKEARDLLDHFLTSRDPINLAKAGIIAFDCATKHFYRDPETKLS